MYLKVPLILFNKTVAFKGYDTSNRTNLDYTVPEHIKQNSK